MASQFGPTAPVVPPPLPQAPLPESDETALALAGTKPEVESSDSRYGSSSDSDDDDFPAGAICPEKCVVGGPGLAGASAGSSVAIRITSRDNRGTDIKEGGAYVTARLLPGTTAKSAGANDVHATVRDNKDGTYTGIYTVLTRGDYQVCVAAGAHSDVVGCLPLTLHQPVCIAELSCCARKKLISWSHKVVLSLCDLCMAI